MEQRRGIDNREQFTEGTAWRRVFCREEERITGNRMCFAICFFSSLYVVLQRQCLYFFHGFQTVRKSNLPFGNLSLSTFFFTFSVFSWCELIRNFQGVGQYFHLTCKQNFSKAPNYHPTSQQHQLPTTTSLPHSSTSLPATSLHHINIHNYLDT